ncbi:MAG: hypothetical protein JXC85_02820 [Candidatus Aenigmarchaeota archaeon]|nr:hypothetical protein [Candidatus Aenigmarchaeota archaeon]
MVTNLENMGFFQYLFPFLLAFAILYGILKWVFRDKIEPRVVALISVVLSFFVMLYSAYNTWLYNFLANASGVWLGMATVLLFIVVLAALAGINLHEFLGEEKRSWLKYLIIIVIAYVVIVSFLGTGAYYSYLPFWLTSGDLWTVLLVIIILAIVFWFVGGEEKTGAKEGEKKE